MSSSGGFGVGVGVAGGPTLAAAQQGQGVAALLVMLAVLCFIFAYCCWGAPFCRSLCRRHCCCRLEDPEPDPRFTGSDQAMVATPTIILLPHGRMLVVDGTIFTQFQTDPTGKIYNFLAIRFVALLTNVNAFTICFFCRFGLGGTG